MVTVGGGHHTDDRGQQEDRHSEPLALQSGAELQVEAHLEVTDDAH